MKEKRPCKECGRKITNKRSDKCQVCNSKARWERRNKILDYYENIKPTKCIKCGEKFYQVKKQICSKCLKKEKFLKKFMEVNQNG